MLARMVFIGLISAAAPALAAEPGQPVEQPKSRDDRVGITLFAEHPHVATPTGLDIDDAGRVWVLESNTHFRPDGYPGHPTDRLLILSDKDNDGRAEAPVVFAVGFTHAMSVAIRPTWLPPHPKASAKSIIAYVATRAAIHELIDDDGDLKCDRRSVIAQLETKGNYPHNGLAGFAFDGLGRMIFGFGENLGADYKLIGSDGATLSGGGEGGNLYRCLPDGSKLEQIATGFWNPHASTVDSLGRIFTVDNDPDSRPPCRLLHAVDGADFGYRFRNGRKGTHPFTSWNGEAAGTMPMVAGTGEAPSGIVTYHGPGLPDEYQGHLLVGSWGDHRVDVFRLKPRGASYESVAEPLIVGGPNFRPVGLAIHPDGSIYITDWVLQDYKLHQHGRVWRIAKSKPTGDETTKRHVTLRERRAKLRQETSSAPGRDALLKRIWDGKLDAIERLEAYWALCRTAPQAEKPLAPEEVQQLLKVADPNVRLALLLAKQHSSAAAVVRESIKKSLIPNATPANPFPRFDAKNAVDLWGVLLANAHQTVLPSGIREMALASDDPVLLTELANQWGAAHNEEWKPGVERIALDDGRLGDSSHRARRREQAIVLAWRKRESKNMAAAEDALKRCTTEAVRLALQWIAEEKLVELQPQVEAVLTRPNLSYADVVAVFATLHALSGKPPGEFEKLSPAQFAKGYLTNEAIDPAQRAAVLDRIPWNDPAISTEMVDRWLASPEARLRQAAFDFIQQSPRLGRGSLLELTAIAPKAAAPVRVSAILGLATAPDAAQHANIRNIWLAAATDANADASVRREAVRSLRYAAKGLSADAVADLERELEKQADALRLWKRSDPTAHRPTPESLKSLPGDRDSGRNVFYHPMGAGCAKCHRVEGRGGQVGPDLSVIARTMNRAKLMESILEPSREISPHFTNWMFTLKDGRVLTGLIINEGQGGKLELGQANGDVTLIPLDQIEERAPSNVSLMPAKLNELLSATDFADLLTYLETLK